MLGLIVEGPSDQGIALEFCSGGALNQWLKHHKDRLHLQQSIQWCLQIGKGMEYLHKRAPASFLHRDLKSSNILLLYPGATDPSKQGFLFQYSILYTKIFSFKNFRFRPGARSPGATVSRGVHHGWYLCLDGPREYTIE